LREEQRGSDERLREEQRGSDERLREEQRGSDERLREEQRGTVPLTPKELARKVFRGQWPILTVGLVLMVAFTLVVAGYWRRGALVMAIAVGLAAVMRLSMTEERAGLLVVRSRGVDFATTASVSAVMLYIAWTIDPLGTS
jgi:hypothetical protein